MASGRSLTPDDPTWGVLEAHGALAGSASAPQITAVGRHVLAELEVRSPRTDGLTLDAVANQLARVAGDLDQVARTAEYFLAELGPVAPPDVLPLLRPVALGLANRRETPEELAAEFRNVWGSVEVMGGSSRDRLLAAELLTASDAKMETMYSGLMSTTTALREKYGAGTPAVASAALLHIHPGPSGEPSLEAFHSLRAGGLGFEEAALLAGLPDAPAAIMAQRQQTATLVAAATGSTPAQAGHAGSLLAAFGADPSRHVERVRQLGESMRGRLPEIPTAAALLSSIEWLDPPEISNWVEQAIGFVRLRRVAPTDPELAVLGIASVRGLPRSEFDGAATEAGARQARAASAEILAIHAWMYRPLVASSSGDTARSAAPATG
ncbi:MAG TPA: hypothetical protein VEY07_01295 [Thermoplasmata archaeon]|nr:hypothetical protein [Thermoplasmata archaeon]